MKYLRLLDRVHYCIVITTITLFIFVPYPTFAQDAFGIETTIDNSMNWFFDWLSASNNLSSADIETKGKYDSAIESTREFSTTGNEWWFSGHRMVVDLLFAGSPIPLDVGIVSLVSIVIMMVLLMVFAREHLKHGFYIILGVGAFFIVIVLLGIRLSI